MRMTTMNKAAIYVKEPAPPHPEGADAGRQLTEAHEFCETKGLEVAALYQDNTGSREQFQRMMADATSEGRPFDHVVVWKLMYFAMIEELSILARDQLEAHGARVPSLEEKQRGR